MVITREVIEQRLAQLREERTRLIANVNALGGAIEMNEEWLSFLATAEAEEDHPREVGS